jgi:hypothetical protein
MPIPCCPSPGATLAEVADAGHQVGGLVAVGVEPEATVRAKAHHAYAVSGCEKNIIMKN